MDIEQKLRASQLQRDEAKQFRRISKSSKKSVFGKYFDLIDLPRVRSKAESLVKSLTTKKVANTGKFMKPDHCLQPILCAPD